MEATFEGSQGSEGAVAPYVDGYIQYYVKPIPFLTLKTTVTAYIMILYNVAVVLCLSKMLK